jgi:cytochrome P450
MPRFLITCDPENVKHILHTKFDNYVKGQKFHDIFEELLGDGIFNVDGARWKMQRKTASHMFNVSSFRDHMSGVFLKHAREVVRQLELVKPGEQIDVQKLMFAFTLDSIGEIAFGVDVGSLHGDVEFARAFDAAQYIVQKRFVIPQWMWLPLKYLTPEGWHLQRALRVLNAFARGVIRERRRDPLLEQKADLLSRFMVWRDDDGKGLEDGALRDVILNFLIAGRDTTAQALSWTFYELARNPGVEAALSAEVASVLGADGVPSHDSAKEMRYTHAVFSETLRLYPSVPKEIKFAVADDVLPDGTRVYAGEALIFLPYNMGRIESLWPEAKRFK